LVELPGCHKVFQILVVHPNLIWIFCTFDEVSQFLQGLDNGKNLLVVDLVILFNQRKCLEKEGDQVPLFVFCRYLEEDSTGSEVGTVGFNSEGSGGVRRAKDPEQQ